VELADGDALVPDLDAKKALVKRLMLDPFGTTSVAKAPN
jgi:hypothetical protein